jgi:hypothetical protein
VWRYFLVLLLTEEFSDNLFQEIRTAKREYVLASAFIKVEALRKLADQFAPNISDVTVVARWRKHDLLVGASDLDVYELCKSRGWRFGVDLNLHGKVYLIDREVAYLGSANLTQRGLFFGGSGNNEFGTKLSVDEIDLKKIDDYMSQEVFWVDDSSYQVICTELDATVLTPDATEADPWSLSTQNKFGRKVGHLWIDDLLFNTPDDLVAAAGQGEARQRDLQLLGLGPGEVTREMLSNSFRRTRLFAWLVDCVGSTSSARYGYVSSKLHDAIMNDPSPYRKEVKDFVGVIFAWCELLPDLFEVTKHAHTSSITLVR